MKQLTKINNKVLPTGSSENPVQNEIAVDAISKAAIIRQAGHEILGSFFGVSIIGHTIKEAVRKNEETAILFDHFVNACQVYKYKLSNFLEYTRFEAGLRDTIFETVKIRSLLNKVVEENQDAGKERNVKISLFISEEIPEQIITDEFRIAQICNNLLNNAVNFSPLGSTVLMEVELAAERSWAIVIKDKGEGMTADEINTAFKLLTTERKTLKNPGGLGLFVTKYLVEDILKGKITLSSQPKVGTICKVILPLNENRIARDEIRSTAFGSRH